MVVPYFAHSSLLIFQQSDFWWCPSRDKSILHVLLIISTVNEFLIEQEVIKGLFRQTPTHHPQCGTPSWINEGSFRGDDSLDTGLLFVGLKKSIPRCKCRWCSGSSASPSCSEHATSWRDSSAFWTALYSWSAPPARMRKTLAQEWLLDEWGYT